MIMPKRMVRFAVFVLCLLLISVSTFAQKKKIMLIGDSITKGTASTDQTGFRRFLHILLTSNGYNVSFVGTQALGKATDFDRYHEAYAGWLAGGKPDSSTNNTISDHIYDWLKKNPADIAFLHIGTNDIENGDSASTVLQHVETILDEIHRYEADNLRNLTVVLAQIINRGDKPDGSPYSITTTKFNSLLKSMVSSRQIQYPNDKIVLVNLETGANLNYNIDNTFPFNNGDMIDVLHPNDNGYKKMAKTIYKKFKELLTPDPSPKFSLISPENGSLNQQQGVKLTWASIPNAVKYRLQISTSETFDNIILDSPDLTDTSKVIEDLSDTTQYYWRAIAINTNNANIAYSSSWTFKTGVLNLTEPILISPVNNAVNQPTKLNLIWNLIPAANSYTLQVSNDPTFNTVVISDSGLTDTSREIQGLTNGALYFWRIIATNSLDSITVSQMRSFITILLPPNNLEAQRNPSGTVTLSWKDNNRQNELGYILERKITNDKTYSILDTIKVNAVSYIDTTAENNFYTYRIKTYNQYAQSGYSNEDTVQVVTSVEDVKTIKEYNLFQNYPNPFNPETVISYQLPAAGRVELKVYDLLGREIVTLVDKEQNPGKYEVNFSAGSLGNGSDLPSGIYLFRLKTNSYVMTRKMMLLK